MDTILKLFDRLTEQLPHGTIQLIRMGAALAWVILATIAIYYAWSAGSDSVPPSGQDLSQARIREKIERERNLANPPQLDLRSRESVIIPDTGEFRTEGRPEVPYRPEGRSEVGKPIPGQSDPREPFSERRPGNVPYAGEDPNVMPGRDYVPSRDPGSSGPRDNRGDSTSPNGVPLFPVPSTRPVRPGGQAPTADQSGAGRSDPPAQTPPPRRVAPGDGSQPSLYPRSKPGGPALLPPEGGR